jgi:hypothetical protein
MAPIDRPRNTTTDPTRTSDGSGRGPAGQQSDAPLDRGRFAPGTILAGRYRVVGLLGLGGMGEVYRADDLRLRQSVALKLLRAGFANDAGRLARLHAEVRIARNVSHPNVCRVHDIGEADGLTFLIMEYVDGEDLAALLTRVGRLPAERAVMVARQICAGLAAVHESGALHRDLKPSNVMIDGRGHARLTDFGLAVAADEARGLREIAGTPAYMAPEQIAGAGLTPQTDLFALGLVLYEMFTGQAALPASSNSSAPSTERAALLPPSSHVADLDPRIERVILQCLETVPERRPASAGAVAAALSGDSALAAAIAAGETPSPDMVVAAGEGAGFKPVTALAVAALTILVFTLHLVFQDHVTFFAQIPFEKPPAVLAERARDVLRKLGYSEPRSQDFGLGYDSGFLQYIEDHDSSPRRWDVLRSGQPAAVTFWCWEDVQGPREPSHPAIRGGPGLGPGIGVLHLDTRGRLLYFLLVPGAGPAVPETAPDWSVPLALAGLDPAALRPVEPTFTPAVFADRRAAWEGVFPDAKQFPLRVEAAALHGRIADFRIIAPWTNGEATSSVNVTALEGGFTTLLVPVLIAGLFLARRNYRLGRGDRKSAWRVGVVAFACPVLSWLFWNVHAGSPLEQWQSLSHGLEKALFAGGQLWVFYMAVEPYARRRWPETLIAWSRLLAGRFRDRLVGRDLLVGTLIAPACFVLLILGHSVQVWLGQPAPRLLEAPLYVLLGPQNCAFRLFDMLGLAILMGMMMQLFLVLMRVLLRHQALALAAFFAVWTAILALGWGRGRLSVAELLAYAAMVGLFCVALRFGLLAAVVAIFLAMLLDSPVTTDLWAWYAQPTLLLSCLFAALVGWGLYASLAGRSLEWSRLLEE